MNAKNTKPSRLAKFASLDALPPAPPLRKAVKAMSEAEIKRRAKADPDMGAIPAGFWDSADIVEPEGTVQITLRLPRRLVGHFKSTSKDYQSRISAVLASYVDARKKAG